MTTTPCADPANDPQAWFISSNGRQYSFDDLLEPREVASISTSVLRISRETAEEHAARVEAALSAARGNRKRAALAKRQAAKSKCYDCPIRVACLTQALDHVERHGTWGGYFEEELEAVRTEQARRRRRTGELTLLD